MSNYTLYIHIIVIALLISNIDNAVIMIIFAQLPAFKRTMIVLGYFVAMMFVLSLIYVVGLMASKVIPPNYVRDLGILPIALGVYYLTKLIHIIENKKASESAINKSIRPLEQFSVNFTTQMASSIDCLALFVPIFIKHRGTASDLIFIITFTTVITVIAVTCLIASRFLNINIIKKYGDYVIPPILILIGVYILYF